MNLKTTLALLLLTAGVALLGLVFLYPEWFGIVTASPGADGSVTILTEKIKPELISRIEIKARDGDRPVILERAANGDWAAPGLWPTRKPEVEALVQLLGELHTRFSVKPLVDDARLADYGLDKPAVVVTLKAGPTDYKLAFAEKAPPEEKEITEPGNRLATPTFLRLDNKSEIVRLAPGLVAELTRSADYYLRRQLFPQERVAKGGDGPDKKDKIDRLVSRSFSVEEKKSDGLRYTLVRQGDDWELSQPVRDSVDPEKVKPVLSAVLDLWAEQFVDRGGKSLADFGLDPPEDIVTVERPGGEPIVLLIGKVSPTVQERKVTRPPPPGLPAPPFTDIVKVESRYAKLRNNDQIFEIAADKLKDLLVGVKDLRDARLARFEAKDAITVEVKTPDQDIVLVKAQDRWRVTKPISADAETTQVMELLGALDALEARDPDVIDPGFFGSILARAASYGTIKVTVEEEKGEDEKKTKTTREILFTLGNHDERTKKLAVRVGDRPRINIVDDRLVTLAKRPALAYRGKHVLDFSPTDLARIEVRRPTETLVLQQEKEGWKLEAPVKADADSVKATGLVSPLTALEATEYVNDAPKPEDLEKYGLTKDAIRTTFTFRPSWWNKLAGGPRPQTLLVGKARPDKPGEVFAKLESSPAVFGLRQEIHDALDQGSLAFRPVQLWQALPDAVTAIRIQKTGEDEYRLTKKEKTWNVSGPFDAPALTTAVEPLVMELTAPRAERYEAHSAKDLKEYGLDTPSLRVVVTANDGKEHTLLLGKHPPKDATQRFAKLADGDGIFVLGDKLVAALDHPALDLLDTTLLTLDEKSIDKFQSQGGTAPLTLVRKGDGWDVTESPSKTPFTADQFAVAGLLRTWSDLRAQRFVAYGTKVDLAKYGLDKPAQSLTVTAAGKTHTLALGQPAADGAGDRYARLDGGPGIAVLPSFVTGALMRTHLDYVDHSLLKFDPSTVTSLKRQMGMDVLEVVKKDDSWQIIKPTDQKADDQTVPRLAERLSMLRAVRIAAFPVTDGKAFGLDNPAAVVTITLGNGEKPTQKILKIGKPVEEKPGNLPDRFAQIEGSQAVGVIPGNLADQLLAPPIHFRDRSIARLKDEPDRVVLERGPRKATFAKVDGNWKMTEPAESEAEQGELDELINAIARLKADELVAEKPTDLKPYGLDKPEAKIVFKADTKELLSLQLGSRDKGGRRCYAKLAGGDIVFLLDPTLTGRVLGEFRPRTVWTVKPDPVQAQRIQFLSATPFALGKVDNTWHVLGKPDVKVSAAAVNDLLTAFADLRLERYVEDRPSDLKLYGLETPELTVEVETPAGRKTLQIGRPEGDSKRRYARVTEKGREGVFVIGEADAARLVRDLAGLTEKAGTP